MEILKINQLPSPTEAEKLLYNEEKAKEDAYLDWCINEINTELSKKSELWLKNHVIIIELTPKEYRPSVDSVDYMARQIFPEMAKQGYQIQYRHIEVYSPGFPPEVTLYLTLQPNYWDTPKVVYEDINEGWDYDNKEWKNEFTGIISTTTDPAKIFKEIVQKSVEDEKNLINKRFHNHKIEWFQINDIWNYRAIRKNKIDNLEKIKGHSFWDFLK